MVMYNWNYDELGYTITITSLYIILTRQDVIIWLKR